LTEKHDDESGVDDRQAVYFWDHLAFLARYFPSFICSIFMCMFSIAIATSLVSRAYLDGNPQGTLYSWLFMMGASLVLTSAGFLLSRGRLWATWILAGILLACLLAVLPIMPTRGQTFDRVVYMLGLMSPLLGLLSLNSKRSREMRQQFVYNRSMRASIREAIRELNTPERSCKNQSKNKTRRK
jgi:hypothetical protein